MTQHFSMLRVWSSGPLYQQTNRRREDGAGGKLKTGQPTHPRLLHLHSHVTTVQPTQSRYDRSTDTATIRLLTDTATLRPFNRHSHDTTVQPTLPRYDRSTDTGKIRPFNRHSHVTTVQPTQPRYDRSTDTATIRPFNRHSHLTTVQPTQSRYKRSTDTAMNI